MNVSTDVRPVIEAALAQVDRRERVRDEILARHRREGAVFVDFERDELWRLQVTDHSTGEEIYREGVTPDDEAQSQSWVSMQGVDNEVEARCTLAFFPDGFSSNVYGGLVDVVKQWVEDEPDDARRCLKEIGE